MTISNKPVKAPRSVTLAYFKLYWKLRTWRDHYLIDLYSNVRRNITSLSLGLHLIYYTLILTFYFLHSWLVNTSVNCDSDLVRWKLMISSPIQSYSSPDFTHINWFVLFSLKRLLHVIVTVVIIITPMTVEFIAFARITRDIDLRYRVQLLWNSAICEKHVQKATSSKILIELIVCWTIELRHAKQSAVFVNRELSKSTLLACGFCAVHLLQIFSILLLFIIKFASIYSAPVGLPAACCKINSVIEI